MLTSKTLAGLAVPNIAVIYPTDRQITEAVRLIVDLQSPVVELVHGVDRVIIQAPDYVDLDEAERRVAAVTAALYTMTEMISEIVRDESMRPALHVTNFKWVV